MESESSPSQPGKAVTDRQSNSTSQPGAVYGENTYNVLIKVICFHIAQFRLELANLNLSISTFVEIFLFLPIMSLRSTRQSELKVYIFHTDKHIDHSGPVKHFKHSYNLVNHDTK